MKYAVSAMLLLLALPLWFVYLWIESVFSGRATGAAAIGAAAALSTAMASAIHNPFFWAWIALCVIAAVLIIR